jgi:hypothetical protein
MTEERVQILREAIQQHLERHGAHDWNVLRERFPDISHATFWRHVKAVRQPAAFPDDKPAERPLPQMGGDRLFPPFFEPLKKLAEYERLLPEVEEMARQAKNSQGKIINWRMYAKSMEMRRTLLQDQITAAQMLVHMEKLQRHYDVVIEVLRAVSPEARLEVMKRIQAWNENASGSA